ncbi:unnamed protein product [Closterium sp. Yama58-4]|nr:unnamed protein product [Closterium sp. Yama58-4]
MSYSVFLSVLHLTSTLMRAAYSNNASFIGVTAQRRNNQGVLELSLDDAVANAISKISENKSLFLKRDELCYSLTSSTSGNLESTISRVLDWHGNDDGYPEISIPTYFDLRPYKGLVVPIEEDLLDDEASEDDAPIEAPSLFDGEAASDTFFPNMEPDVHGEALHYDAPNGEDKDFDDICDFDDFDLVDKLVEEHEAKKAARAAENANLPEEAMTARTPQAVPVQAHAQHVDAEEPHPPQEHEQWHAPPEPLPVPITECPDANQVKPGDHEPDGDPMGPPECQFEEQSAAMTVDGSGPPDNSIQTEEAPALDKLVVSKFREADSSSNTRQSRQIRDAERLLMPPQQCEEPIPSDPWDDTDMDRDMFRLSLYRSRFDIVSYREKLFTDPSVIEGGFDLDFSTVSFQEPSGSSMPEEDHNDQYFWDLCGSQAVGSQSTAPHPQCSMGSSAVETSSCGNARGKRPRLQDLIEQVMSRDAYPEHLSDPSSISALSHKLEKDIAVAVKSGERVFGRDHLTNMLGLTAAKGTMTAQRYLMVLLNLAHHHNMLPPERREPTISDTDFVLRCSSGTGPSCVELSFSAITSVDG